MTDTYVYYFTRIGSNGASGLSGRRATFEAIKAMGAEPVMESQLVVDHTEVDENGFVIGHTDDGSRPLERLLTQIRSLERRAQSRDNEAMLFHERDDAQRRYMLGLESRELRRQAQCLRRHRLETMSSELGYQMDAGTFMPLGGHPAR